MGLNNKEFQQYKDHQISIFKEILITHTKNQFDEQALPSYTNPNPLMRYLFWERIKVVMNIISHFNEKEACLDFGCGLGVMVPYLLQKARLLYVLDLDTTLLQEIGKREGWQNITYVTDLDQLNKQKGKLDLILALDVLEHVDNLSQVLDQFAQLLSEKGMLIITGPTENFIYKIGRKLANYSGEYHERNIYDIQIEVKKRFEINSQRTLYKILPFFEIFVAKKLK